MIPLQVDGLIPDQSSLRRRSSSTLCLLLERLWVEAAAASPEGWSRWRGAPAIIMEQLPVDLSLSILIIMFNLLKELNKLETIKLHLVFIRTGRLNLLLLRRFRGRKEPHPEQADPHQPDPRSDPRCKQCLLAVLVTE